MAYHGEGRDAPQLVLRTIRGTFDFKGRSRRAELVYYYIALMLVGFTVFGLLLILSSGDLSAFRGGPPRDRGELIGGKLLSTLIYIPFVALFVRRLHDHGQPGCWVALPIAGWLFEGYRDWLRLQGAAFDQLPKLPWWIALPIMLLLLVLSFRPGTVGPNRYGEDPRLSE